MLSLTLHHDDCVSVLFNNVITSLGEKGAGLFASRAFLYFVSLPLGITGRPQHSPDFSFNFFNTNMGENSELKSVGIE